MADSSMAMGAGERLPYMRPPPSYTHNPFSGPRQSVAYPYAEPPPPVRLSGGDPQIPPSNPAPFTAKALPKLPEQYPSGITNPGTRYTVPSAEPRVSVPVPTPRAAPSIPSPAPKIAPETMTAKGPSRVGVPISTSGTDRAFQKGYESAQNATAELDRKYGTGYSPEYVDKLPLGPFTYSDPRSLQRMGYRDLGEAWKDAAQTIAQKLKELLDRLRPQKRLPQHLEPLPNPRSYPPGTTFGVVFRSSNNPSATVEGPTHRLITEASFEPQDDGFVERFTTVSGVDLQGNSITTHSSFLTGLPVTPMVRAFPLNESPGEPFPAEELLRPADLPISIPLGWQPPMMDAPQIQPDTPTIPLTRPEQAPVREPDVAPKNAPEGLPRSAPSPNRSPSPAPAPVPSPSPSPASSPSPFLAPSPSPTTSPSPRTTPYPQINPTPEPKPQPQPQPEVDPPLNPTTPKDPNKDCCCDCPMAKQAGISVPTVQDCNEKPSTSRVSVPNPLIEVVRFQAEQIKKLGELICAHQGVASVPEWWQIRAEGQRKQLAIVYAEKLSTGKLTTSRWTMHIPHYNRPKGFKPSLPEYDKGNWQGILTLKDNSKIIVNASTSTECKRVLNRLKILVPVEYRVSPDGKALRPKISELVNSEFKKCRVTPIRADFYSTGMKNLQPDWSLDLRKT